MALAFAKEVVSERPAVLKNPIRMQQQGMGTKVNSRLDRTTPLIKAVYIQPVVHQDPISRKKCIYRLSVGGRHTGKKRCTARDRRGILHVVSVAQPKQARSAQTFSNTVSIVDVRIWAGTPRSAMKGLGPKANIRMKGSESFPLFYSVCEVLFFILRGMFFFSFSSCEVFSSHLFCEILFFNLWTWWSEVLKRGRRRAESSPGTTKSTST